VVLRHTSPTVAPRMRGSIPISQSCDTCKEIPQKHHPRTLGLNLRTIGLDEGFDEQALLASLCEKMSPSPSNAWLSETELCLDESLRGVLALFGLLGLTWDFGPFGLLPFCHFAVCAGAVQHDYRGHFLPTSIYIGYGVTLVFTSHLLVAFSFCTHTPTFATAICF
jgi:hypothetical protein